MLRRAIKAEERFQVDATKIARNLEIARQQLRLEASAFAEINIAPERIDQAMQLHNHPLECARCDELLEKTKSFVLGGRVQRLCDACAPPASRALTTDSDGQTSPTLRTIVSTVMDGVILAPPAGEIDMEPEGEGGDEPAILRRYTHKELMGREIVKWFTAEEGGHRAEFKGTVRRYDETEKLYGVDYNDGDQEEFTYEDLVAQIDDGNESWTSGEGEEGDDGTDEDEGVGGE